MVNKQERYEGINGLKAYAILGIVLMHVLANGNFGLRGFLFEKTIPSFTNLVFLFMMVSAFGMCCGYYQKIVERKISMEEFYARRFAKIWPFFAFLCILDFVISPSMNSLYEVFANLTLCQGLLPAANISVIGVSWTLAVIFVFYMLFPFFCFLIGNKRRAWGVFILAGIYHYLCTFYFVSERQNFIYDAVYFVAGGLIFLYRKELYACAKKYKAVFLILFIATAIFYMIGKGSFVSIMLFCIVALICTLGASTSGILVNPVVKFLGNVSFEIYLSHMVIYRIIEKANLVHLFENQVLSFVTASLLTIIGSTVFAVCVKWGFSKIKR